MKMYICKSHEKVWMLISWKCIDPILMKMYTSISHGNAYMQSHGKMYMQISWKCIHTNLMKIDTCKAHENASMQFSWKCLHTNLIEMDTCKSHGNVYMQISWKCIHANLMKMYTCKSHENVCTGLAMSKMSHVRQSHAIKHVLSNISMEAYQFYLQQSLSSKVNYWKDSVCHMFSKNFTLSASKFKECFRLKQASNCYKSAQRS